MYTQKYGTFRFYFKARLCDYEEIADIADYIVRQGMS